MRIVNQATISMTLKQAEKSLSHQVSVRGKAALKDLFAGEAPEQQVTVAHDDAHDEDHLHSDGLSSELAAELLKKFGRNELPEVKKAKWLIVSAAHACLPACLPAWAWMNLGGYSG